MAGALAAAVEASTARRAARAASVPETPVTADLPIAGQAEAIARAVADHPVTLAIGTTGSGKSTQLPKICLGAGRGIGAMNGRASHRCHDRTMKYPSFAERAKEGRWWARAFCSSKTKQTSERW